MRDRLVRETPTAGSTLPHELELIVEEILLAELEQIENSSEPPGGAPPLDPAWLSEDPALD